MTATPIPRTLAISCNGDLDVSTIPVVCPAFADRHRHVTSDEAGAVAELAERVGRGEQGYVVVPVIDESESLLKDIAAHLQDLQQGPLADCTLAALHGRMHASERDEIMYATGPGTSTSRGHDRRSKGIDVLNATMTVIEQAERFGLGMHQLRGRRSR